VKIYVDLHGCSVSWILPHWISVRASPQASRTYSTPPQRVAWLRDRLTILPVNSRGEIDVPTVAEMMRAAGLYSPKTYRLDMERSVMKAIESAQGP